MSYSDGLNRQYMLGKLMLRVYVKRWRGEVIISKGVVK